MILLDIPEPKNCDTCIFYNRETGYCCPSTTDGTFFTAKNATKYIPKQTKPDWCPFSNKFDKVYVVTTGDYSDYKIRAVTVSKEKAEKLKKYYSYGYFSDAEIEEYDINEPHDDLDDLVPVYYVKIYRDGKYECRQTTWMHEKTGKLINRNGQTVDDLGGCTLEFDPNAPKSLYLQFEWYGTAKDEEHALKIAQDKRTKLLEKYYFDRKLPTNQTYIKEEEESNE